MRTFAMLVVLTACVAAEQFPPADVMIAGDIDYGQTSAAMECPAAPRYCALVFNGHGGDQVQVNVARSDGRTFIAIADGTLKELARGVDRLVTTLPRTGDDPLTWYIVLRDDAGKPARFTVELKKIDKGP